MLNLSNEAIRRMYIACKENDCFPGELPTDEHDTNISIHAILEGLGLLTDGMLPFDTPVSPSDESGSRRQSQSTNSVRPPRADSGSSNPSLDGVDNSSMTNNGIAFPSSQSVRSSASYQSFEELALSPPQANAMDSNQPHHDGGPPFLHNLDYLSFGPQNHTMPMASLAGTTNNVIQPPRNDFLFPWPGTFAAAMGTTDYHHQQ